MENILCGGKIAFRYSFGMKVHSYTKIRLGPGIKSVLLDPQEPAIVSLGELEEAYPDVEELVIGRKAISLDLKNSLFPNLRKVTSQSRNYISGPCLVSSTGILENAFCRKPGEPIDLAGVSYISSRAFDGCMSTDIINAQGVAGADPHALDGSALGGSAFLTIGHVLLRWTDGTVDMDDRDCCITEAVRWEGCPGIQKAIVHNKDSIPALLRGRIGIRQVEILDDSFVMQGASQFRGMDVSINTPLYRTVDGIVYTADMKSVVYCPSSRTGDIVIPEGPESVLGHAFAFSKASSVTLPDSTAQVLPFAFERAEVPSIHFGKGFRFLNDKALYGCKNLRSVHLPASCLYVGEGNLKSATKVTMAYMPAGFLGAALAPEASAANILYDGSLVLKLQAAEGAEEEGAAVYLPKYIDYGKVEKHAASLPLLLQAGKFREAYAPALSLYQKISQTGLKQETAVQLYLATGDADIGGYLKRSAKSIVSRYLSCGQEGCLIRFLKLKACSAGVLGQALAVAQGKGMASAAAYILDLLRAEQIDASFRL